MKDQFKQGLLVGLLLLVRESSGAYSYLCSKVSDPKKQVYALNRDQYELCGVHCSCMVIETLCFTEVLRPNLDSLWVFNAVLPTYAAACGDICVCNIHST